MVRKCSSTGPQRLLKRVLLGGENRCLRIKLNIPEKVTHDRQKMTGNKLRVFVVVLFSSKVPDLRNSKAGNSPGFAFAKQVV
jgi:hypothetical protein